MGVQELKNVLQFSFSIARLIDSVVKEVSLSELGEVLSVIRQAGPAIAQAPQAFQEYLALTPENKADVDAFVQSNLQLDEPNIQAVAQQLIELVISLSGLFGKVAHKSLIGG